MEIRRQDANFALSDNKNKNRYPVAAILRREVMTEPKAQIRSIRVATQADAPGIFALLTEVASEIPLLLDTKGRQEAVSEMVKEFASLGESLVAIDNDGVTGFLLVKPDVMERSQRENQALNLSYAGVTKSQRKQGIFLALARQVMSRNVPLTATVKLANQSGMAAMLKRIGFQEWGTNSHRAEAYFKWQPAA